MRNDIGEGLLELGNQPKLARFWLESADKIAHRSGNQVNHAGVRMLRGFLHHRFGIRMGLVKTLSKALLIFGSLRDLDCRQKEQYMARKFPNVWPAVIKLAGSSRQRRPYLVLVSHASRDATAF
jgi:hypothetical protein